MKLKLQGQVMASGLRFPEGPIVMPDGSVLVVEIAGGCLTRVSSTGEITVVAELGGGPNGAAIGPDGHCYVCNNGGFSWRTDNGFTRPIGPAADYQGGVIQRVNLRTGAVRYSRHIKQLYGYEIHELGESIESWRALVHPDNQSCFIKGVQKCLSGEGARLECELRVRCKDGSYKWILCRGAIFSRTPDGLADRLIGTQTDITAYKGSTS